MNETLTRTISGIVYIVLLILTSLYLDSFLLLFGFFLVIAVIEFCDLVRLNKVLPLVIALLSFVLFSYFLKSKISDLSLLSVSLVVSIKLIIFLFQKNKVKIDLFSKYVFLIGYLVFPIIIITKIPLVETSFNPKIIIGIFILIWTNDTFAFLIGKTFGKNKLLEHVSPKKTVEGFIGGLAFALIFSVLIAKYFIIQSEYKWLTISILVSLFGTIGDLIESKFKRIAGVKDSGKIMPGHGGILDRLDSVIFVAPFVFLFYQILNYVS